MCNCCNGKKPHPEEQEFPARVIARLPNSTFLVVAGGKTYVAPDRSGGGAAPGLSMTLALTGAGPRLV